jgi:hypothetical protein
MDRNDPDEDWSRLNPYGLAGCGVANYPPCFAGGVPDCLIGRWIAYVSSKPDQPSLIARTSAARSSTGITGSSPFLAGSVRR